MQHLTALLGSREALVTTNPIAKERTDANSCDNDWCDGPKSNTLPCFACFDPKREYECVGRRMTETPVEEHR